MVYTPPKKGGVMSHNLGDLPRDERDKANVDLAASGVAYKERMNACHCRASRA